MAELADAPDLGSGVHDVQVQVLLSALNEFPEVLEIPVFPGIIYISKKKLGHKRGKFIKV